MYFGVDYYPEHWPRERWQTDAEMMAAAHINVVRMGEFAWALLEPREGKFDFAWLDEAIALLGEHGISTVLGTPTATPPKWLMAPAPRNISGGSVRPAQGLWNPAALLRQP